MSRETTTVELEACYTMEFRSLDASGQPVPDCRVVLSKDHLARPPESAGALIGNPLSDGGVWAGNTDAGGTAILRSLPAGVYNIYVIHSLFAAPGTGGMQVKVPGSPVVCRMRELIGAAASTLPGRRIAGFHWRPSMGELVSPSKYRLAEQALLHRFPGARVFVGLPLRAGAHVKISATAILGDGQIAFLDWYMLPIRQITDPAYMAPREEVPTARATLRLLAGGLPVLGMPIQIELQHVDRSNKLIAASGQTLVLPCGVYRAYTISMNPVFSEAIDDKEFRVSDGTDNDIVFEVPQLLHRVHFAVDYPAGDYDVATWLGIQLEQSGGFTRANWFPDQGPLEFWLPAGHHQVSAYAPGFSFPSKYFEVPATASTALLQVPVHMRRKPGKLH